MAGLATGSVLCRFCGLPGEGFELGNASVDGHRAGEFEGAHGCVACLAAGRFEFEHNTDIGTLSANGLAREYRNHCVEPATFHQHAHRELRRTPDVLRWQYEPWLTHCDDYMAYIGEWRPSDFARHAVGGDARALFLEMTREAALRNAWDDSCRNGEKVPPEDWRLTYYAYRCLHCGVLAGNWDCD